jgi:hypothetical protein
MTPQPQLASWKLTARAIAVRKSVSRLVSAVGVLRRFRIG